MPERSRVRIIAMAPRSAPPDGQPVIRVDLRALFELVEEIGHNPGLLYLTLRALRQRHGLFLTLGDLVWVLRTNEVRVRRWLGRLAAKNLIVFQLVSVITKDTLEVEFPEHDTPIAETPILPEALARLQHELPTIWFLQVLPRVGRKPFLVYLLILSREASPGPGLDLHRARTVLRMPTRWHIHWHLATLKRHRLLSRDKAGHIVLHDPPPPTFRQRLHLRLVELRLFQKLQLAALLFLLGLATFFTTVYLVHLR